ncbi:MAG: hypothetical protein AAF555_08205 [Verrucomicrobiota bacterium]
MWIGIMWGDHFNALLGESLVQFIGIIGSVSNEAPGAHLHHREIQGQLH